MDEMTVTRYLNENFAGVRAATVWGDTFFYYNPDPDRPDEHYFATIKSTDDDYDNVSNLSRPGYYRLNIGLGKDTYFSLFESRPARPGVEGSFDEDYDFAATDTLMPHPIYGRQYWVSIVNPSAATFERLRPLLEEAYGLAVAKVRRSAAG